MRIERRDDETYVLLAEDGTELGTYANREDAISALRTTLAEQTPADDGRGPDFQALLLVEGIETGDGRYFEIGSVSWRELPIPVMVQEVNERGHDGSYFAGQITRVWRDETEPTRIRGEGQFSTVNGDRTRQLIRDGLTGISVDVMRADVLVEVREVDADGWPVDVLARFDDAQLGGATVTPFPAFEEAIIWLAGDPEPARVDDAAGEHLPPQGPDLNDIALLAAGGPVAPPAEWFTVPEQDGPTPLTVTGDGQVYGHAAIWGTCHLSFQGERCISPPVSPANYAHFHLGEVVCDDGTRVAVGTITAGGGHAGRRLSPAAALAHYDDVSTAVADVRAVDGHHGIWVCGALRPDVTDETLRTFRASPPSGDWRKINGALELVGVHCVNTPGFPVLRASVGIHDGDQVSLVASVGALRPVVERVGYDLGAPLHQRTVTHRNGTTAGTVTLTTRNGTVTTADLSALRPAMTKLEVLEAQVAVLDRAIRDLAAVRVEALRARVHSRSR